MFAFAAGVTCGYVNLTVWRELTVILVNFMIIGLRMLICVISACIPHAVKLMLSYTQNVHSARNKRSIRISKP